MKISHLLIITVLSLYGCGANPLGTPVGQSKNKPIVQQLLPYHDKLQKRTMDNVDLVVLHSTELPTLSMARSYGEKVHYQSGTGNSGHYYVDRDGQIYQYVTDDYIANHVRAYNERSIGIEIINNGRYPNWYDWNAQTIDEPFTPAQIQSTIALIQRLSERYPSITSIAGHSDLDRGLMPAQNDPSRIIRRKVDPGPLFSWPDVMSQIKLTRLKPD